MTGLPFLTRIGGRDASSVMALGSRCLSVKLADLRQKKHELRSAREKLVEELFPIIGESPPGVRRLLLRIKRDCFNQRIIGRHRGLGLWSTALELVGDRLGRVVELEDLVVSRSCELKTLYGEEKLRQRAVLVRSMQDDGFMRGLAVSNVQLRSNLDRLLKAPMRNFKRREVRLERTLARFLTRSALKLSPYSTLTKTCLGVADESAQSILIISEDWRECSTVRLKRSLVEQMTAAVIRSRKTRSGLLVKVNGTVEWRGDLCRFIRPADFTLLSGGGLKRVPASLVRFRSKNRGLSSLLSKVPKDGIELGKLESRLCHEGFCRGEGVDTAAARDFLDRCLEIGILIVETPWSTDALCLEEELLKFLEKEPRGEFSRLRSSLLTIVSREKAFAGSTQPVSELKKIHHALVEAWGDLGHHVGTGVSVGTLEEKGTVFEDVFVSSSHLSSVKGELLRVPADTVSNLRSIGGALWALVSAFSAHKDFMKALYGLVERKFGRGNSVAFLDVFYESQALWREFVAFRRGSEEACFDPMNLESMSRIRDFRSRLRSDLDALRNDNGHINPGDFLAISRSVPSSLLPKVGPCLFVQPVRATAEDWVLNRMFEGTGRFSSRFLGSMPPPMGQELIGLARANGYIPWGGRTFEVIDVAYSRENTANLHPQQTWRVILTPGESSSFPVGRILQLSDLRVVPQVEDEELILTDGRGQALLPCHLSAVNNQFLPVVNKLLAMFGPGCVPVQSLYDWRSEVREGVRFASRLTIGSLTTLRRRWVFEHSVLPQGGTCVASDFQDLNLWRLDQAIPREVYWIEQVGSVGAGRPLFKPQYLNFESPVLVELFLAGIRGGGRGMEITFEEALPGVEGLLDDDVGKPWAVELMIDEMFVSSKRSRFSRRAMWSPPERLAVCGPSHH